jgi:hypothetical protein
VKGPLPSLLADTFLAPLIDIHRMFADFQSQHRKKKIEAALEPSSLISVSRSSIFTQNTGE